MRPYIANNKLSSDILFKILKLNFNPIKKLVGIVVCSLLLNINPLFAQNTLDKIGLGSSANASVAYSLRQLSSSYTGPLVRIRIGSSFYDVYPDASTKKFALSSKISASIGTYNAAVSTASANALSSMITSGTTNATVAIWYDQSGNSVDVLTNSATGPKIITSGSINTMNGLPSIYFAAVSANTNWLASAATVNYSTQTTATINAVVQNIGSTQAISGIISTGTNGGWGLNYDPTTTIKGYWIDGSGCWNATSEVNSTTSKIITGMINTSTSSSTIYENSLLKQAKNTLCNVANGATDNIFIGNRGNASTRSFDGNITEVILFPTNLSAADQSILESNQNATYFSPSVSITSDASNNTICAGSSVTFTANTSNITSPTYQWKKNGTAISGETASTYTTSTLSNNDVISVDVFQTSAATGSIVNAGLALQLDAGNTASYSGSGTTWTDISGNNKNATLTSDQSFSSANGGSIQFNGGNNSVSIPLVSTQNTNITMQCWVYLDATSKGPFFKNGINNGYTFGVGNGGNEFNTGNRATMLFAGTRWIPTTTSYGYGWKFVTMTINASGVPSLYIDKTLVSGDYSGTNAQVPTTGTYLGRNVGDDDLSWPKFNGKMAAVYFYNRALTALEIAQNFDATSNRLTPIAISSNAITTTVNAIPTPTFTTQPGTSACLGTDVTYTTQSGQSNYTWTIPGTLNTDYSITSGGVGSTSNTVTLKWLTSGSKTVSINYSNASGCSPATATSATATTVNAVPSTIVSNALNFDGNNDYLISNADGTAISEFTIEAYINPSNTAQNTQGLFQWANTLTSGNPFVLFQQSGTTLDTYVNGGYNLSTTIPLGSWSHVALTYSNGVYTLFLNGVAKSTYNGGMMFQSNATQVYLGNGYNGYWNGSLDEVRFWSRAKTQAQIQANMNNELAGNENGLLAYYNFNQGIANGSNTSITTITDKSVNGYIGTLNNFARTGTASNFVTSSLSSTIIYASSQSICLNGTASAIVATAEGTGLTYKWYSNALESNTGGTIIPLATLSSYTPLTTTIGTTYYYVVVTNASGCAITSNVSGAITVNAVPSTIVSNALNFDGNNDYVQITGNISGGNNFSYNTLFNANTGSCGKLISSNSFEINYCNGALEVWTPGASVNANPGITPNTWHKLSVTYNNPTLIVYLDGNIIGTNNSAPSIGTITNPKIGQHVSAGCCFFNGAIDETSFWNITLSPSTVASFFNQELIGTETGLTAFYNYNQGNAAGTNTGLTSLTDKTGNGNNAVLYNFGLTGSTSNYIAGLIGENGGEIISSSTQSICQNGNATAIVSKVSDPSYTYKWYSNTTESNSGGTIIPSATSSSYTPLTTTIGTTYYYVVVSNASGCAITSNVSGAITVNEVPAIGGFNNALDFNGTSSYVAIPQSSVIRNLALNTFSMEAMVSVVNTSNVNSILRKTGDYNFFIYNQKLYTEIWTGGEGTPNTWKQYIGTTTIPSNTWTHVAAVWNGTTFTFYVNGVLDPSTSASGSIGGSETLSIGKSLIYGDLFNGKMDEVRIWNTARTITEIQNNRKTELLGSETGLIAYYNFNQGINGGTNNSITSLIDNSTNLNHGTLNNFTLTGSTNNFIKNTAVSEIISSAAQNICKDNVSTELSANMSGSNLSYLWYSNTAPSTTGGTLIPGVNSSSYTPLTNVSGVLYYYVVVSNESGCSITSNLSGAITVFPTSTASPILGPDNVCINNKINLSSLSLDTTTPFTVAYSLRKLKNTYAGYAIKVRRSSDGTESNIGFNASGDLDETALKAFAGTGNAFVSIWYDQSGNAKNMVQINTSLQPQIVFSGNLKYIGTRPTIDFYLNKGVYYNTSSTLASASAVVKSEYTNWPNYHAVLDANNRIGGLLENGGNNFHFNQFPSVLWKNGTSVATNASLSPTNAAMVLSFNTRTSSANNLSIGNYDGNSNGGAILQSEVIGFASTISSSDRQKVEANQGNYYGITVASAGGSFVGSGSWSSDNTAIATINSSTGEVTGVAAGTANIAYSTADINGCQAIATKVINVYPNTTPTFTVAPTTSICANNSVTYTTQTGQSNYTWTLSGTDYTINSGGIGSTDHTVTLTWTGSGNRTVTVNYSNVNGCFGTTPATNTLEVAAIPILNAIQGVSALGIGGNSILTNAANGGLWTSSNNTLLSIDPSTGEINALGVGNAVITYTYTSPAGCVAAITKNITIYNAALNRTGKLNSDLTTYVARSGEIGNGSGLNQKGEIVLIGNDGLTSSSAAKSAAEIKKAYPNAVDGVYWIDVLGSGPKQTYCLMDSKYDGGGWMLALKSTRGTTFNYDANYWTTNNTLNPANTNRNDGDAKFDVMNTYTAKDMMALWPDIANAGTESGSIDGLNNWSWLQNNFNSGDRITLINKFLGAQTDFYTSTNGSMTFDGYNQSVFSYQGGFTWYGINYTGKADAKMRWGFAWNNETDQSSNDVSSGIGMGTGYSQYSAGDKVNCCATTTGINRSARVEIYIR